MNSMRIWCIDHDEQCLLHYKEIHVLINTWVPYLSVLKPGSNTRRGSNILRVVQYNERINAWARLNAGAKVVKFNKP